MALDHDAALAELYQAPHGSFVEERKRLVADLKAAGDKASAASLAKRARPTISAWVVNQLWWHARDAFSALLTAAAKLRDGDLSANTAHREALVKLRTRAGAMLSDAGHTATETTLRRVAQTIAAIAATGSWEPDAPGTLAADRDPPGFDAAMLAPIVAGDGADAARKIVEQTEASKRRAAASAAEAIKLRKAAGLDEPEKNGKDDKPVPVPVPLPVPEPVPAEVPLGPDVKEVGSELKAAKARLAEAEANAEKLRTQLAAAKEAVAEARRIVDDLQAQLDEA